MRLDQEAMARAEQIARDGSSARLGDVFSGDWDRAHVFPGLGTREHAEEVVGSSLDIPSIYQEEYGGIVVLTLDGEVQQVLELNPFPFLANGGTWRPDARVAKAWPDQPVLRIGDV